MANKPTPNANNYSAFHIAQNKVEYNPQRKDNFMLIVDFGDDMLRVGAREGSTDAQDIIKALDAQNQLILTLKSCSTPKVNQSTININRGNSVIKFAGKPTFSDMTFEAYDYIGSFVKDALLAWQNQSYNTTYDYIGNAKTYKKHAQLLQLTPNGTLVRYWDIEGMWLTEVTPGDYDFSQDSEQSVSCTASIDWAEMHLPDNA